MQYTMHHVIVSVIMRTQPINQWNQEECVFSAKNVVAHVEIVQHQSPLNLSQNETETNVFPSKTEARIKKTLLFPKEKKKPVENIAYYKSLRHNQQHFERKKIIVGQTLFSKLIRGFLRKWNFRSCNKSHRFMFFFSLYFCVNTSLSMGNPSPFTFEPNTSLFFPWNSV